jgi:hypothetical protein
MDRIGHYLSSFISNKERTDSFDTLDCVQIISVKNGELILNSTALQNIFVENPQLEYNPLKVIVTCGLPRIGKSTFCNLILKEKFNLENDEEDNNYKDSYSDHQNKSFFGKKQKIRKIFETRKGHRPQTSGIWITNKPLIQKVKNDFINVMVVDCEGIFNSDPNERNDYFDQKIFVIGALMASDLIYVVNGLMNKSHEQLLKLFVSSASSMINKNENKPFQNLFVIFRDWPNEDEFKYGFEGGQKYFEDLNGCGSSNEFNNLELLFNRIVYFLMPEPEQNIRKQKRSDSEEFLREDDFGDHYMKMFSKFRSYILNDETLKYVNDLGHINGSSFCSLLQNWITKINANQLTEIPSQNKLFSDMKNGDSYRQCLRYFTSQIKVKCETFIEKFKSNDFEECKFSLLQEKYILKKKTLEIFRKLILNGGKGLNDVDDGTKLCIKIESDFEEFIENSAVFKNAFLKFARRLKQYMGDSDVMLEKINDKRFIDSYKKFSSESLNYFKSKAKNNAENYGIDLENILVNKMQDSVDAIEKFAERLKDVSRKYDFQMKESIKETKFLEFHSNKIIEIDNELYPLAIKSIKPSIEEVREELEIEFRIDEILYAETEKSFKKAFSDYLKTENLKNIVGGTGSSVALIAGGAMIATTSVLTGGVILGAGAVGLFGAITYRAVRFISRPNRIREKMKKD